MSPILGAAKATLHSYRGILYSPDDLEEWWRIKSMTPPYRHSGQMVSLNTILRLGVQRGLILLATPTHTDPARSSEHLDALMSLVPWASIVVQAPDGMPPVALGTLLTRLSRHGATLAVGPATSPGVAVAIVLAGFEPATDVRTYLRQIAPRWQAAARDRACRLFIDGFNYVPRDGQPDQPLPRRHPLWTQVGRAMAAALLLQRRPDLAIGRVGSASSYADANALTRALDRSFGVTPRELRGTAGWEWLMWRFLSGLRSGKGSRWDNV